MDDLDMNISNYSYEDLLNLFKLEPDFTTQELKNAKSIVYKVHPDKSGLDKEYFLFFSKAYKMLYSVYQFREGSSRSYSENDDYVIITKKESESNRKILESHKEFAEIKKNPVAFNNWFNEMFEKNKGKEENDGHGKWLSSEITDVQVAKNPTEMAQLIEEKKKRVREQQLTLYKTFEPLTSTQGENLLKSEGPQNYQSGLFSKLQYDDLKEAHENSVIPITQEDFKNRKTFRNIDEMNRQRKMDELDANNMLDEHETILKNMERGNQENSIHRYYDLMKQETEQRERNQKTWSNLKRLK